MTLLCSRNLTQQPAFGGDDIAFPIFGLRTKARRLRWVTLSEQKWVILAERRGAFCLNQAKYNVKRAIMGLVPSMYWLQFAQIAKEKQVHAMPATNPGDDVPGFVNQAHCARVRPADSVFWPAE
jgi:hypothetical protein